MDPFVLSVQEKKKVRNREEVRYNVFLSTESQIHNSIYKMIYTKKIENILRAKQSMTAGHDFTLTMSLRCCESHIYMPYMYMYLKKEYLSLMNKNTNI